MNLQYLFLKASHVEITMMVKHGAINYCKILHPGCKLSAKSYRAGFNIFKNR